MITLPVDPSLEFQSFSCLLDGKEYGLELRWNARAGGYLLAISDADGPVLSGRRVVVGFPLLVRCRSSRRPPGEVLAIDTSDRDLEAGLGDLGARVDLVYVPGAELVALLASA